MKKVQTIPRPKRFALNQSIPVARNKYILRLFVAGATTRSHQAVLHVRNLCQGLLKGRVKMEVIDIYQQPQLARDHQIVATPTLVIVWPLPMRRFIGNLSTLAELFNLIETGENGTDIL